MNLSNREREVIYLIAHEYSSKEIANKLCVSPETVRTHRKNIMTKMSVKNMAGIVRVAFERHLLFC